MSALVVFLIGLQFFAVQGAARNKAPAQDFKAEAAKLVKQNLDLNKKLQTDADDVISPDRIKSGRIPTCDDGKTGIKIDWDGNKTEYQCGGKQWPASSNKKGSYRITYENLCHHLLIEWFLAQNLPTPLANKYWCEPKYPRTALHYCIKDKITYTQTFPTSERLRISATDVLCLRKRGNHRPTWPTYGEYKYIPMQRWLHGAEHGAIIMLYHPCADPAQVDKLRKLVTGCLRRHVITPFKKLSKNAPFALMAWGCKLVMGDIDEAAVKDFIKNRAKRGAEQMSVHGAFNRELIRKSEVVPGSDFEDSNLCPAAAGSVGKKVPGSGGTGGHNVHREESGIMR